MKTEATQEAIGLEELFDILSKHAKDVEYIQKDKISGFSRTIAFRVKDRTYTVVWFKNHSTLRIGGESDAPQIPFRHVFFDTTFPLVGGNRSLAFCYDAEECSWSGRQMEPFASFRIPLGKEATHE